MRTPRATFETVTQGTTSRCQVSDVPTIRPSHRPSARRSIRTLPALFASLGLIATGLNAGSAAAAEHSQSAAKPVVTASAAKKAATKKVVKKVAVKKTVKKTTVKKTATKVVVKKTVARKTAAGSSQPIRVGLPINSAEVSAATLAARLDDAKAVGVTTVQTGAVWWYLCPTKSSCDFSTLDRLVAAANQRGMNVAVQVTGVPDWVHPDLAGQAAARRWWTLPRNDSELATFTAFTRQLAARYAGRVQRYEIWNEPNLEGFSYPSINPALVARTIAAGYKGVKAGDPAARVVTGGLSRADIGFASSLLTELAKLPGAASNNSYYDEVGIHPYSDHYSPLAQLGSQTYTGAYGKVDASFGGIDAIAALLDSKGRTGTRIWLGEYGFSTTTTWMQAVPDARRALFLMMAADRVRNHPRVAGLIWYGFLPHTATEAEWTTMSASGTPSLTFKALGRANSAGPQLTAASAGSTCASGALAGTVSLPSSCFSLPTTQAARYEVYVDGVMAASGPGSTARLDTAKVTNGTHRVTVAYYPSSGVPFYTPNRQLTVNNSGATVRAAAPSASALKVNRLADGRWQASTSVTASPAVAVQAITIAARSSAGANLDFPGMYSGATLTSDGLKLNLARSLPKGTYTAWVAYQAGGKWTDLPNKVTFTVA